MKNTTKDICPSAATFRWAGRSVPLRRCGNSERVNRAAAAAHQRKTDQRDIGCVRKPDGAKTCHRENKQKGCNGARTKPVDEWIDKQSRHCHEEGG